MKKRKSAKTYKRRRTIAGLYILMSLIIGFPMSLIGTGGENCDNFNPVLYWVGLALVISGLSLFSIIDRVLREEEERKYYKDNNRR